LDPVTGSGVAFYSEAKVADADRWPVYHFQELDAGVPTNRLAELRGHRVIWFVFSPHYDARKEAPTVSQLLQYAGYTEVTKDFARVQVIGFSRGD
jgi:hypothetical protein